MCALMGRLCATPARRCSATAPPTIPASPSPTPAEDLQIWEKLGANGWSPEEVLPLIKKPETTSRDGEQYGHDGPVRLMDVP